ncbi:DUF6624 domain-containing protein [Lysobacter capsici]|uniref:DUF6624 domain-containing protein n=1 Tax=Lysobacter capsici TaxID=435897 RepID=UPI001C00181C|nr:DUF6624 domain-containing protein [Lysobacter capsici]QWF16751.1 type 2 lantipeptide synthetase LanM [Lysobacter capsici]
MSDLSIQLPARAARDAAQAAPEASAVLRRWLGASAAGGEAWWWPPRVRIDDDGLLQPAGAWKGPRDAARIGAALRDPRLRRWGEFLDLLDRDCTALARRHAATVAAAALSLDNGALHALAVRDALLICLAGRRVPSRLRELGERHRDFLRLFLHRLARDSRGGVLASHGYHGRVQALWANPEETHNGRQSVLRLQFERGGALAYKPRPADSEIAFLADHDAGGLFARLNRLAPASGAIRLPTLRVFHGRGGDRAAYLWQEWIEPPRRYRRWPAAHGRVQATVLPARQARGFWHRAGSLTAACFGFGLVDLGPGNVLCGERDGETMLIPVDLEVCLFPARRLEDTGLVTGERDHGRYPAGLERALAGEVDGPVVAFFGDADGVQRLHATQRPWRREHARSLVVDREGRAGYGAYTLEFLRGMFDLWMLVHLHRDEVMRDLRRVVRGRYTRVLVRATADYAAARDPFGLASGDAPPPVSTEPRRAFSASERAQLRRGDVPYFFRRIRADAPLLALAPPPQVWNPQRVGAQPRAADEINPSPALLAGESWDLLQLGVALRDAVAYVLPELSAHAGLLGELDDPRLGVRLQWQGAQDGEVAFDWPGEDRRLVYRWAGETVGLRIEAISDPPTRADDSALDDADAIGERLLRIDRLDAVLRTPWTDSGFTDAALETQLHRQVQAAMVWLREVVDRHGWPGRSLVGADAAAAACRLLQHADGPREFQDRCLALIAQAARDGEMSLRDLAYLTDALRVQRGRRQCFGTKFRRRGSALVPCPIERPAQVDARRREMGLEPLAEYAERIRATFAADPAVSQRAVPERAAP